MNVLDSLAVASVIALATSACAAPTAEDDAAQEAPEEQEPLEVTVDTLDVVHGALRLSATMVDGAAGVSMRLGGDCEQREVGGGLSTLSTVVWSLGDVDVADAIGCGLLLRARVRDGTRYVNRVAELGVAVDVAAEGDNADDGPQLQGVTTSELGVSVLFSQVTPGARLATGDSILEAAQPKSEEEPPPTTGDPGPFNVPAIDFARSVLGGRRLRLEGSSFVACLSVGGAALQAETQGQDETQGSDGAPRQDEAQGQDEAQEEPDNSSSGEGRL
jgi:hypothetical protein